MVNERTLPAGQAVDASWLIGLRWGSIAGQVVTILVAWHLFGVQVPFVELALVVGAEIAMNLGAAFWRRRRPMFPPELIAALFVGDALFLTLLLYFTGGAHNPFNFLYLVNIVLAAVVLGPRLTWLLAGVSAFGFGFLFFDSWPVAFDLAHPHDSEAAMALHMRGMWVAFVVAAAFIIYFVGRVTRELSRRNEELRTAREAVHRAEKLSSLATLAAGAAHELSTPLSTIALVSSELTRQLQSDGASAERIADAKLIRTEVSRCRTVLDQLAVDAGQTVGDTRSSVTVATLIAGALEGIKDRGRVSVTLATGVEQHELQLPLRAVQHAIRALVNNALEASTAKVDVSAAVAVGGLELTVIDYGPGMSDEVLTRATEPFFTTKSDAGGMGLGLFLVNAVARDLGGRLDLSSKPGQGTRATLSLPLAGR